MLLKTSQAFLVLWNGDNIRHKKHKEVAPIKSIVIYNITLLFLYYIPLIFGCITKPYNPVAMFWVKYILSEQNHNKNACTAT